MGEAKRRHPVNVQEAGLLRTGNIVRIILPAIEQYHDATVVGELADRFITNRVQPSIVVKSRTGVTRNVRLDEIVSVVSR